MASAFFRLLNRVVLLEPFEKATEGAVEAPVQKELYLASKIFGILLVASKPVEMHKAVLEGELREHRVQTRSSRGT